MCSDCAICFHREAERNEREMNSVFHAGGGAVPGRPAENVCRVSDAYLHPADCETDDQKKTLLIDTHTRGSCFFVVLGCGAC